MSLVLNVEILGEFRNLTKATQGAQNELGGLNQKVGAFSKFAKSAFASIGVGLSFALIARELSEATKAAVEDQKSQALLAKQLENTTGATKKQIAQVEKQIGKLQLSASVADDELRPAFAQFTRITGDTTEAMKLLNLATEVSAGSGKQLTTVTMALSKAYDGKMGALQKLGVPMTDSIQNAADYTKAMNALVKWQNIASSESGPEQVKAMKKVAEAQAEVNRISALGINWQEDLAKAFAGSAATAAETDPYQRLTVVMGELQESVGVVLLPVLEKLATFLVTVTPKVQGFFKSLMDPTTPMGKAWAELGKSFVNFGTTLNKVFTAGKADANGFITVLKILTVTLDTVSNLIKTVSGQYAFEFGKNLGSNVQDFFSGVTKAPATKAPVINTKIPTVNSSSPSKTASPQRYAASQGVTVNVTQAVTAKTIIDTVSAYQKSTGTTLAQALR